MAKIDWHAGFVPAMKLELIANEKDLIYEEEHPVDNRGNIIDLLIIKNARNVKIKSCLGSIFDRYNIIEYKSPEDTVTLGSFYKTLAYTCLYLKERHEYAVYGRDAFTMTIICTHRPVKMMKQLFRDGIICSETDINGIYSVTGKIPFNAQIVVTNMLNDECEWIELLTKKATRESVHNLINSTKALKNLKYKEYAVSVTDVFIEANKSFLNKLKEEDSDMDEYWEVVLSKKTKQKMAEKEALIAEKDAELKKQQKEIIKLKKQIAKLQSKTAVL